MTQQVGKLQTLLIGHPLECLLIVGNKLAEQRGQLRKGVSLRRNMRRVGEELFAVPDKLAKPAEPQLLTQPHNRRGRDKCRLRQFPHRDVTHQQWMLRKMCEYAILRAGQRFPAR